MKHKALLVALTISLWGCDQNQPNETEKSMPVVEQPVAKVEVKETVVAEPIKTKVSEDAKKPKKKLNLAIPAEGAGTGADSSSTTIAGSDPKMLPNMFESSDAGTKVGGGLLRDAENEDYVDSVQGAQLNVEFKTD